MLRWDARSLCLVLIAVGVALTVLFVVVGMPPPGSDDAWYKGPAASLAMYGRMANPGLTEVFERADEISAVYPQLAEVFMAGFYAVFGVSRRTSIAWDMTIHVLATLAIATTGLRLTRGFEIDATVAWWAALVTGLVWLGGHRLLDRLEAVGLLFVWLDLALLPYRRFTASRAALAGVFAGLAGLCAPWAGVLGGALIAGRALADAWTGTLRSLLLAVPTIAAGAVTTIGLFSLWAVGMEWLYPGILDEQFFGAIRATQIYEGSASSSPATILAFAARNLFVEATVVPGLLLAVLWLPVAFRNLPEAKGEAAAATRRLAIALTVTGVVAMCASSLWRPTTYFYLWASAQLVMPGLTLVIARFLRAGDRLIPASVAAVAWAAVVLTIGAAFLSGPRERLDGAHAALREIVPPGERVAVTTTHWIAFQGRNPWGDAAALYKFDPTLISTFDWLILGTGKGRDRPEQIMDQFELVDSVQTDIPTQLTYGWAVYRRVRPGAVRENDKR